MSNNKHCEKIDFNEFDNELECLINAFLKKVKKNNNTEKTAKQYSKVNTQQNNTTKKVIKKLDMNKIREAIKKATETAKENHKYKNKD